MTTPSWEHFGEQHFGAADLGDRRRTRTLVELGTRFAEHPGDSLPQKCRDANLLRRCYDLMNTPSVTHERVLAAHVRHTLERIAAQTGVVLLLHDHTELDYSSHDSLHDQLGQIGNGFGRGYLCHNSLAVVPDDAHTALGLVQQTLHVRANVPEHETPTQRRDRESRESLLWVTAVQRIEAAEAAARRQVPPRAATVQVIDVCDRGGDTFEFLDYEDLHDRKYVVRSMHNRRSRVGHDDADAVVLLHTHLRSLAEQDRRVITVHGRDGRPDREATVAIAWAGMELLPPQGRRGHYREAPLKVWAIRVWEPAAPAGVEAVEWFLLTNVPVTNVEEAWEKVDWYTYRWVIEEYHKAQKTGVAIEAPQFTTAAALQPMIALLSVVAVSLLQLRAWCRTPAQAERPAREAVDAEYVEVLSAHRYGKVRDLTVREFVRALARLGGHLNRRGDGEPGWLVLWRGWGVLQLLVAGARVARQVDAARAAAQAQPPPAPPQPHSG